MTDIWWLVLCIDIMIILASFDINNLVDCYQNTIQTYLSWQGTIYVAISAMSTPSEWLFSAAGYISNQ